jgi:hypothetical protein
MSRLNQSMPRLTDKKTRIAPFFLTVYGLISAATLS